MSQKSLEQLQVRVRELRDELESLKINLKKTSNSSSKRFESLNNLWLLARIDRKVGAILNKLMEDECRAQQLQ